MSERSFHQNKHETDKQESNPYGEHKATSPHETTPHSPEHENHAKKAEALAEILKKVEKEAESAHELSVERSNHGKHEHEHTIHASDHLKSHASNQTLHRVQKQLSSPERAFSKVIHNNTVDSVSNLVGESVARPSGLLMGGIFSVIGSLGVLLICRFYGYEYNFLIGLVFFVGGFLLGLVIEAYIKLRGKRRRRSH